MFLQSERAALCVDTCSTGTTEAVYSQQVSFPIRLLHCRMSVRHRIIFLIIHLNLSGGAGVEDAGVITEVGYFDVWIVHSRSLC